MRFQAIELEQVGTFSAPVRIDNIGPGLNVLAGANELGKSTLLRGLMALFTEQHRTTRQSVRDLRPYAGGAPLMACTFELQGHAWRLEKRYLSAHKALLQRLDGSEQHQGADAENRLAELLGEANGLATNLPLLWVGQGAGAELPAMTDSVRQSLGQLLAAEADSTSGIGRAQAVLRAVEAELGQLVTLKTGKARKNSDYYNLLVECTEVSATLEAARHKAGEAQQRLERLAELQRDAAALSDRDAMTARQAQLGEHEARLNKAREARRQLQQLDERVVFLGSQHKQREATLAAYDEGLRERAKVAAVMSAANEELSAIAIASEEIAGQTQTATDAVMAGAERTRVLRGQLDQFRQAGAQAQRHERLQQLGSKRQRLAAIAEDIDGIATEAASFNWPDDAVSDLRRAVLRLEQLRARKAASAPRVRFAYEAGRSAGFRIAGADIRDGADMMTDGPMTIEVEGVGRIEVVPARSENLAALSHDLVVAQAQVADVLTAMRATDLADAEAREQRRLDLRNAHQMLVSERDGLAPEGDQRLAAEAAQLRADEALAAESLSASDRVALPASVEDVERDLTAELDRQTQASARLETLKADTAALDQRRAAIAAELRIRRTRRDELDLKYAKADGAAEPRDQHAAQVAAAAQEFNAAVRVRLAVQEVALSQMALTELERTVIAQRAEIDRRLERLAGVRQEMRHVEGMLTRDFEDGAGDQVRELEGRLEDLNQRLRDTERHIAALRLLVAELAAETSQRRDAIARPLSRRLTRMAARIWTGAEIQLTSDLTVEGLARGGHKETTERVSSGTREQIAVLARLAYAGLLAEGAQAVPVILDDPLVFSDDQRLDALFDTIAEAAQDQQIIVLTCHERAFEPLMTRYGATRLKLVEATVAAA